MFTPLKISGLICITFLSCRQGQEKKIKKQMQKFKRVIEIPLLTDASNWLMHLISKWGNHTEFKDCLLAFSEHDGNRSFKGLRVG